MKLNVFGQFIRIELIMLILVVGGFIGVTFLCNCNGNMYEGLASFNEGASSCGCGSKKQSNEMIQ